MISDSKTKIIDKKYAIQMNKKLGNGTYGDVYTAYSIDDAQNKIACKVLSKK